MSSVSCMSMIGQTMQVKGREEGSHNLINQANHSDRSHIQFSQQNITR